MGLYRNRANGWFGGVCAGIADHWEVPAWLVRLCAVFLFTATGTLAFWAYLAGWLLIAPAPNQWAEQDAEDEPSDRPAPSQRLREARDRLDSAMARVRTMEGYVTSRRYQLDREFSKL